MARQYGKMQRGGRKQQDAAQATEIRVNIADRHTIEQLALEVQRALAIVQDYGVTGVERFRLALLPLDADGSPMVLRDELGRTVTIINIPDVAEQPIYRPNEPGVGVSPITGPVVRNGLTSTRRVPGY